MPGYEHSCFFSYKHPPVHTGAEAIRHFWMEFIVEFQARLEAFSTIGLSTYRDDRLRSRPGVKYPTELSLKLCRSVCLIAILVPEYLESSWCLAEWQAMEKLERERAVDPASAGFIIPVLFRGDDDKFSDLCGVREYIDFRHVARPRSQLDTIKSRRQIEDIARQVAHLAKSSSHTDCSSFIIRSGKEIVRPRHDDPNPLA
jgi:hypothetical protein